MDCLSTATLPLTHSTPHHTTHTDTRHRPDVQKSQKPAARYCLVRSISATTRSVSAYAGPTQLADSPFDFNHLNVIPEDRVRYQDFAPFLLVSTESIADLNKRMGTRTYPIESFRGNIGECGEGSRSFYY